MHLPPIGAAWPASTLRPAAEDEAMQVWAQANKTLAVKVTPGQSGYDAIVEVLEQLPADERPAPPSPVPAARPSDAQYQTWALAHKDLAMKVRPGQAGHAAVQSALAELPPSARLVPPPPVPAPGPSDAQYQIWALNNEALARNVRPGQAGYAAIQAALATLDRGR
jgi:hypothetical protein